MTQDKSSNRSAAVKSLLIRAWRERWTPSQYGTQIKTLLGKGMSGDDVGLSEQIIQLAVTGPSPNKLLFSLLDHSLASQLVTYAGVLLSVSRFTSYSRPHCTSALLNLVLEHKPYITARGDTEECMQLGTSLVSLATWTLNTTSHTLSLLAEVRESKIGESNLERCMELMTWLLEDMFIFSLLYTGRLEDQEAQEELVLAAEDLKKVTDQIYSYFGGEQKEENALLFQKTGRITELAQRLKSLDPPQNIYTEEDSPSLILTLQILLSYDVLLQPTSDLNLLAGQLLNILHIRREAISTLVCEIIRCCLLGMNDSDRYDMLRWDAFTMLKLPKLIEKIFEDYKSGAEASNALFHGLFQVLQYTSLLDMADAKCKANTYELIVTSLSPEKVKQSLLRDTEYKRLLALRVKQLEARKQVEIKSTPYSESRDINMIFKADSTLQTIINTFEHRTTDPNEFENLLSVMFHIIKGSSFDLLLSAASANGTLPALVSKLLFFNEGTQESMGESNKVAQNRAALFDMTFLMLVYMVQCFSTSVLLGDNQDGFFPRWAKLCMPEPGHVKPLDSFKELGCQESIVDGLLQQVMQGNIRTQVVMWNQVCSNVHDVMKEILLGVEMGSINAETYSRLTLPLYNKLCCLPICIGSWLVSMSHYGEGEAKGQRPSAMAVLDRFINISGEEDTDTRPYFAKRSNLMTNILKKMRREMEEPIQAENNAGKTQLSVAFDKLWESLWEKQLLDIAGTKEMAKLFNIGGTQWFMEMLVEKIVVQVYQEDVSRCTEMVFSIMHIDLAACTLSLLLYIIPNILTGNSLSNCLCYPAGNALARLTVSALAAVLKMKNSGPYVTKRRLRSVELDDLCNTHTQPVKLRKLSSMESVPGGDPSLQQEQLIVQAHLGLFELLSGVGSQATLSPKLEFVACILEECVKLRAEDCSTLLSPLSPSLVTNLIKLQPDRFPIQTLVRLYDPNLQHGRRNIFAGLCLLRNIRAKRNTADS